MTRSTDLLAAVLLMPSVLFGQQPDIEHTFPSCIPANENAYLTATIRSEGTPRLYFRKRGTTDWCSVDGNKTKDITTFVLPRFQEEVDIEYYMATIGDGRITGRSPHLYRVASTKSCRTSFARHVGLVVRTCAGGGPGDIGTALGAGYMLQEQKEGEFSPSEPSSGSKK